MRAQHGGHGLVNHFQGFPEVVQGERGSAEKRSLVSRRIRPHRE